jgi:hypothetical protein
MNELFWKNLWVLLSLDNLVNEITIQVVISMLNKLMIVAKDKFLFSIFEVTNRIN